jgi:hypothetical protein
MYRAGWQSAGYQNANSPAGEAAQIVSKVLNAVAKR